MIPRSRTDSLSVQLLLSFSSFLVGALTILSFAPYRYYWLAPISLVLLFFFIDHQPRYVGRLAYFWGVGFFMAQCYWVNTAIHEFGGVPTPISLLLTLLLPLYLAVYPYLAVLATRLFSFDNVWRWLLVLPLTWTVGEFIREHFASGFGWGTLGYSQASTSPLIAYASIGGVLLVTYFVVLTAALLWLVIQTTLSKKLRFMGLGAMAVIILFGVFLKGIDFTHFNGQESSIGIVQLNDSSMAKHNRQLNTTQLMKHFVKLLAEHPNLEIIFFPETALPVEWEDLKDTVKKNLIQQARAQHTFIALGALKQSHSLWMPYNAVIIIDPRRNGFQFPFYAKRHLVPLGEYKAWPWLSKPVFHWLHISLGELTAGPHQQMALSLGKQKVAFNICYEESFGDELVDTAISSTLIANASNMGWYGSSYAMDLQLQQAQVRAIELGRYVVRTTNTGYSAIIDNKGAILAYLPRDQQGFLQGTIKAYTGATWYMRLGGSRPIIMVMILLLFFLLIYDHLYYRRR